MGRFKKLPVIVDAVQFVVPEWMEEGKMFADFPVCLDDEGWYLSIPTLEGVLRARQFDWIITGIKGEKYPCRPDIFAMTYEPVNEDCSM